MVCLVAKASFIFIIRIREKSPNPSSRPAKYIDNKENLYFIAWVDEAWVDEAYVILGPECGMKLN